MTDMFKLSKPQSCPLFFECDECGLSKKTYPATYSLQSSLQTSIVTISHIAQPPQLSLLGQDLDFNLKVSLKHFKSYTSK